MLPSNFDDIITLTKISKGDFSLLSCAGRLTFMHKTKILGKAYLWPDITEQSVWHDALKRLKIKFPANLSAVATAKDSKH